MPVRPVAVLLAWWTCGAVLAAPVPRYRITPLSMLPNWISSGASDIRADGAVVGHGQTSGYDFRAALWPGSGVVDLGTLGGERGLAHGASDSGLIAGQASLPDGQVRPVLWDKDGIHNLGTLGGGNLGNFGRAVNNFGQVVGSARTSSGEIHAFLWEKGAMLDLGVLPGGSYSIAVDINDQAQIVGMSEAGGGFLWQDGTMTALGTLEGDWSEANAINAAGDVVGTSTTGEFVHGDNEVSHAVLWRGGRIIDLGTLGGYFGIAWGIDNAGRIVGTAERGDGAQRAFLWQDGVMYDLSERVPPGSGWELRYGQAINDSGQIAATGRYQQAWLAVRLDPLPLGDLDWSGAVDPADLELLLAAWGPCAAPCTPACVADIDGDCDVGILDFLLLLANWTD